MKNLQKDLKSEQESHQTCKIELAKREIYKERPKIEGKGVDAGCEERYEECGKTLKETSLKLEKCQGNKTNEF